MGVNISGLPIPVSYQYHPLNRADEHTKQVYITMLAAVAQNGNAAGEIKITILKEWIRGIQLPLDLRLILSKSILLDQLYLDEFVRVCSEASLSQNFIVDAIVISGSEGMPSQADLELIAAMAEVLRLTREELNFLGRIAQAILQQDEKRYLECFPKPNRVSCSLKCYIVHFCTELLFDIEEIWSGDVLIDGEKHYESANIAFVNANVRMTGKGQLHLSKMDHVLFLHSSFFGNANAIAVRHVKQMRVEHCRFTNFHTKRALDIYNAELLELKHSKFFNCSLHLSKLPTSNANYNAFANTDYASKGGAMLARNCKKVVLNENTFLNCSTKGSRGIGSALALEQCKDVTVSNTTFKNCKNKSGTGIHDVSNVLDIYKCLRVIETDNQYEGCTR